MRSQHNIDYANIAFNMPSRFGQVYQSMDANQCEALVAVKNSKGQNIIDLFENQTDKINILIYIFENLSPETIYDLCIAKNSKGETFLHRLATYTYANRGSLADVIFKKLETKQLSQLLLIQDDSKKTIFHYQTSIISLETMQSVFSNEPMKLVLNKVCVIQDISGKTILHHFAKNPALLGYFNFIIDNLTPEVFNNIINLRDSSQIPFMGYFAIYNLIEEKYKIHLKLKEKCKALNKYENYLKCIAFIFAAFPLLNSYRGENCYDNEYKSDVECMIKLSNDILFEMQVPIEYLAAADKHYYLRFANTLLSSLDKPGFDDRTTEPLRTQIEAILLSLLKKIPNRTFTNTYRELHYSPASDHVLFNDILTYYLYDTYSKIGKFLTKADYLPGVDTDPLALIQKFRIETNVLTNPLLSKYHSLLFVYTSALENPKEFLEFYQKIINYQVSLQKNFNPIYIRILEKNLEIIKNRDLQNYPDTDNKYTECMKQIQVMLTILHSLTMNVNAEAALNLKVSSSLTDAEAIQSGDFCSQAAENVLITPALKLRLQVIALQFYYKGLHTALTETQPSIVLEEKPSVQEEKEEGIQSLDDNVVLHPSIDHAGNYIALLNTKITAFLDLPSDDIHNNKIDEENYNKAIKKYPDEINTKHAEEWKIHLNEFGDYIRQRASKKPTLFTNSKNDYHVRKAYYDILTTKDTCLDDLYNKIAIINLAANDHRLTHGRTQQCLDILNKLKFDFYLRIYLFENRNILTDDFELHDNTISSDNYSKELSINELANIAFHLKDQSFHLVYPSLTAAQCNEIIAITDAQQRNIVDHYTQYPKFLIFLFSNLTQENINKICLMRDKQNKTLLHKLASQYDCQEIIDLIYKKVSPEVLAEILTSQDKYKNTPLHYRTSSCSPETFQTVFSNPLLTNKLKDICALKDKHGRTFVHCFAENDRAKTTLSLDFAQMITAPLKETNDAILQAHLEEFKTYIERREQVKPTLFGNSRQDYNHRRAYYDIIKHEVNDIDAIRKKLQTINDALNDKLLKGFSHQCRDIIKKLKKDYEAVIFFADFEQGPSPQPLPAAVNAGLGL